MNKKVKNLRKNVNIIQLNNNLLKKKFSIIKK